MKLLGTVLGFEIGTGNDNDTRPNSTRTETDTSTSSKPTTDKKNEQSPVIKFVFSYLCKG